MKINHRIFIVNVDGMQFIRQKCYRGAESYCVLTNLLNPTFGALIESIQLIPANSSNHCPSVVIVRRRMGRCLGRLNVQREAIVRLVLRQAVNTRVVTRKFIWCREFGFRKPVGVRCQLYQLLLDLFQCRFGYTMGRLNVANGVNSAPYSLASFWVVRHCSFLIRSCSVN